MKTMEELRRQGIEALARELGPIGMAQFLQLFENRFGDYVKERHSRQDAEDNMKQTSAEPREE